MPDYLLDTGILVCHLRDHKGYVELTDRLTDEGGVFVSVITRLEIIRGMKERERKKTFDLLDSLETVSMGNTIADLAGELIRSWRTRGITIGEADAIIAASASSRGLALVTTNSKHFPMPDLIVYQADEEGKITLRE
ncbi:MAG: PIN domain-containing protein [Anaerolineales bacterium]|nr:PIN domain-containing protein [Anaerolineales bacterium]